MPTKFMQSLDPQVYAELRKLAKERGITMQELIRAVIVPDWMKKDEGASARGSPRRSRTAQSATKRARARITA
jgi:Ribbon-helix-helix protein, copG family